MLRKLIHIVVWICVFAYLVMALAFTEKMENAQTVDQISVELMDGAEFQFISRDDVVMELKKRAFRISGMLIDSIDRSAIRDAVNDIVGVKDVSVYYTPDNDLHIRVWQRKPVVRIISGNMNFYLDDENILFRVSPRFSPRVLVMTGIIDPKFAQDKLYDLAMFIQEDPFYNSLVQEIHVNEKQNLEIIPRLGKHRIFMGDADNYEWKLTKLMAFYRKVLPSMGWDKYSSIDLRYEDQVVCKKIDSNSIN